MRYFVLFLLLFSWLTTLAGGVKAIYGHDDRRSYDQLPLRERRQAASIGMMVSDYYLLELSGFEGYELFSPPNLQEREDVCSTVNFSQDEAIGQCTGFLISENILVTAKHCLPDKDMCSSFHWVFGRTSDSSHIDKDQVYKCRRIQYPNGPWYSDKPDMVLVHLDRPVKNYYQLDLASSSDLDEGSGVYALGHPSGLSLKGVLGGKIDHRNKRSFQTNLDLFKGNSGSPIFDTKSGKVVGMVVSGERDFRYNVQRGCFELDRHKEPQERALWVVRNLIKFFSI